MKLSLAVCALAAASAAAYTPQRSTPSMGMDRRAAFGKIGAAAVGLAGVPAMANADGSVSTATLARARGLYGERVFQLKSAVDAGDFKAVVAEKNAFVLFNSGAYANNKAKKNAAIAGTNKIFAAIRAKDTAALKSAYAAYIADNAISGLPDVDPSKGQGYSADYDYRVRSKAG